jgi:LacI family transcriptional regulator
MPRKLVTIRDVAARAGVSVSTVSYVLNGKDEHVGEMTQKLVREAVQQLGYRPNAIARSMVRQRTATIGLVLTEVDNPLFSPVVAGVEEVLRPAGYSMVLISAPDVESEIQAIETLLSQQVDGFIFMSLSLCTSNDHLVRLQEEGLPLVLINRCIEEKSINLITWADREAGYSATRHLLSLGHRAIGTISGPLKSKVLRKSALDRHAGWQQAMSEANLLVPPDWIVDGLYTYEGGYQAIYTLLAQVKQGGALPSALFIASDVMAVGAIKALQEVGLRIPEDIAVVTTGDPPMAAYIVPALTTLSHPIHAAGKMAASIVLDWLTTGEPSVAQQTTLSFIMKVRESCGAKPKKTVRISSVPT